MPATTNLIKNGNFSQGLKNFRSDYSYVAPDPNFHTNPMQYSVISNPHDDFANGYDDFGDHSNGRGKMLFVDGSGAGTFWNQSVVLAADTTYSFTYFVRATDSSSLATIGLTLNGNPLSSAFQITESGAASSWEQVTASFTTTHAGRYQIALSDLNGSGFGNDFAVDDIALTTASAPTPDGTNLLKNGDFSKGDRGFFTDYTYLDPDRHASTGVGDYSIVKNPGSAFANGFDSYGDHTSGSGKMLLVDGMGSGTVWGETVTLAANTTYSFSYYVCGADADSPPVLQLALNGAVVDGGFHVSGHGGGGNWQQVVVSFAVTDAGTYSLALSDANGAAQGNDFTLDDMKLVAASTVPVAAGFGEIAAGAFAGGDDSAGLGLHLALAPLLHSGAEHVTMV